MNNPTKDQKGSSRVHLGGHWDHFSRVARVSYRHVGYPKLPFDSVGFRFVRNK
mgnify:CR=1 FL=1